MQAKTHTAVAPLPVHAMSRARSQSAGPVARRTRAQKKRKLWGSLPPEMKEAIQDYLRHTNDSLRAAVAEYFEDKAATERRYGKIGTWDVGRVTDMSRLFEDRSFTGGVKTQNFDEARAGVGRSCHFLDARRGLSMGSQGA